MTLYLSCSISEKPRAYRLLHFNHCLPTGHHVELVSIHDSQHLLADVLSSPQAPRLDKILVAPRIGEFVVLPGVVDSEESEVVTLGLVELGLALVGNGLLFLEEESNTVLNLILRMEKKFSILKNARFSGKGRQSLHI